MCYTSLCTGELNAIRKHNCFLCSPFHGRACRWAMLGELKPKGPKGEREITHTIPACVCVCERERVRVSE